MILAAAILTSILYAGAITAYIFLPRWARLRDSEGIAYWYGFGWIVMLTSATIPTALLWTHF